MPHHRRPNAPLSPDELVSLRRVVFGAGQLVCGQHRALLLDMGLAVFDLKLDRLLATGAGRHRLELKSPQPPLKPADRYIEGLPPMTIIANGMVKLCQGEHVHYLDSFQDPPKRGIRVAVIFDGNVRGEALITAIRDNGDTIDIMMRERSWSLRKTVVYDRWMVAQEPSPAPI